MSGPVIVETYKGFRIRFAENVGFYGSNGSESVGYCDTIEQLHDQIDNDRRLSSGRHDRSSPSDERLSADEATRAPSPRPRIDPPPRKTWRFSFLASRATYESIEPKPCYVVSVWEKPQWRTLLTTFDKDEAQALRDALIADDVEAVMEVISPLENR